jgi:hypothetical protein
LKSAKLEKAGVVLHETRRVGERAESGGLCASAFEGGKAFLLRCNSLRICTFEFPRKDDVADLEAGDFKAETLSLGDDEFQQSGIQSGSGCKDRFKREVRGGLSKGLLRILIERCRGECAGQEIARGVDDSIFSGEGDFEGEAVRSEDFLTGHIEGLQPRVEECDLAGTRGPVATWSKDLFEGSLDEEGTSLVLEHKDTAGAGCTQEYCCYEAKDEDEKKRNPEMSCMCVTAYER